MLRLPGRYFFHKVLSRVVSNCSFIIMIWAAWKLYASHQCASPVTVSRWSFDHKGRSPGSPLYLADPREILRNRSGLVRQFRAVSEEPIVSTPRSWCRAKRIGDLHTRHPLRVSDPN